MVWKSADEKRRDREEALANEVTRRNAQREKINKRTMEVKIRGSDLPRLKKNIARLEVMLRGHDVTNENRIMLEQKLKSWLKLLSSRDVEQTDEEEEAEIVRKRTLFEDNKSLVDVFNMYWYLVLPMCISGNGDGTGGAYLTQEGFVKFNINLYIALTDCRNRNRCLNQSLSVWRSLAGSTSHRKIKVCMCLCSCCTIAV